LSTPFVRIFQKFLVLIDDPSLCRGLSDYQMTELLWEFLDNGKSLYFKRCKKNLELYQEHEYFTEEFTADGVNKSYILSQYPTNPNSETMEYIAKVNGVDANYTFDELTQTIILDNMPMSGDIITIGYLFSGQFDEDLTSEEVWILSHSMVVSWATAKVREENAVKNTMTTKDYVKYSPANMLNSLLELERRSISIIEGMTVDYTFNSFEGFDYD